MRTEFILTQQEVEWLYMLLQRTDVDTPHGRFFHKLADSILPAEQPSIEAKEEAELQERHSQLVDKKFLAGLSQAEAAELSALHRRLDEIDSTRGSETIRLMKTLEQAIEYKEAAQLLDSYSSAITHVAGNALLALLDIQEQVAPRDDGRFPSFSAERVEQLHDYLRVTMADTDIKSFLGKLAVQANDLQS